MRTVDDRPDTQLELPVGDPDVDEIVERCREVAAATGFAWIHDLVREEFERLTEPRAAA